MAIPDPIDPKAALRNTMRRMLRGNPADSQAACESLRRWLASRPALQTLAVFAALPGEVDLTEFVARHPGRCWAYPRVAGNELMFHPVQNPATELVVGAMGIREPAPALPGIPLSGIDAFVCPGLAFDLRGGRLGRGRGFYDRMLAMARPDAAKVGICFSHQIVPDTFAEAHDIPMDEVLF